ncbi:DUF6973 domain-containing protein [Rubritalea marina]|uniref:DUF6973 domain-containing protein n=1 Tax=Rubritalea marina TaxID=361055 RepID=UPI00036B02F6|nr:hypothetical protein [Rubritalea marina]
MSIKRLILILSLGFVLLCSSLWIARHSIVNTVIDRGLVKVTSLAANYQVELKDLDSGPMHIPTPFDMNVQDLRSEFDIGFNNRDKIRSRFEADKVELMIERILPPVARFTIEGFSLKLHPDDMPDDFPFDHFNSGVFLSQPIPVSTPKQSVKAAYAQLLELFTRNKVDADFNFSGNVAVPVKRGELVDVLLYTEKLKDGARRLRFKREDLEKLAAKSDVRLSSDTLDILSDFPLRVPFIMLITHDAKSSAATMRQGNKAYPEDAHRHITWSYHLTKEFGPAFAKRVTDSHETLDGNTPNERKMDYHNNAVARELVAEGVRAEQLSDIILNDPRVIRDPNEVPKRSKLLR